MLVCDLHEESLGILFMKDAGWSAIVKGYSQCAASCSPRTIRDEAHGANAPKAKAAIQFLDVARDIDDFSELSSLDVVRYGLFLFIGVA